MSQTLLVQLLAALEHGDELLQPPDARLRLLRVLELVDQRVAVRLVQGGEELSSLRARVQRLLQIVRDLELRRRRVGRLPAPVRLRELDLREAGRAT